MIFSCERTEVSQNFQFPRENEVVYENPPTFIWIPVENVQTYTLFIYDTDNSPVEKLETGKHYCSPKEPLKPGKYFWAVESDNGLRRDNMEFEISDRAVLFERPDARELFEKIPVKRPYFLFEEKDIARLLASRQQELGILRKNAEAALSRELPGNPLFHLQEYSYSYRSFSTEHLKYCDRDLIACALLYALTKDEAAGKHGRLLLFRICDRNPLGPCALDEGSPDGIGLSNIRCLPAAFDMLMPLLSEKEAGYIARTIAVYAKQCEHSLKRVDYEKNPSNSHAGRLPCFLGGAAMVLKGTGVVEDSKLIEWIQYALDIYCGIFPYYGGADGSWAEGPFYSTSYTKWYLPFFSAVERFTGKSLLNRPFYHRYTNFLIHFCNADFENHPFGDGYWCGSDSEEWPGFFAQNPYIVYADKFGPELAVQRMEKCRKQNLYTLHLLDLFLPEFSKVENSLAKEPEDVEVFPDGGFVAIHKKLNDPDDITVLARASRFSYDSHRHADQGSFALFSGGTALISPSGYYGWGYGTAHHREWTKKTRAHNALLFNDEDQTSVDMLHSTGRIVSVDKEKKSCLLDLSSAYQSVKVWQREITLEGDTVTVTDFVESEFPVAVTYPLHTLSMPEQEGNNVTVSRKGRKLLIEPAEGDLTLTQITDSFGVDLNKGVPEEYAAVMPPQYHITYKTPKARKHRIAVKYHIKHENEI